MTRSWTERPYVHSQNVSNNLGEGRTSVSAYCTVPYVLIVDELFRCLEASFCQLAEEASVQRMLPRLGDCMEGNTGAGAQVFPQSQIPMV